MQENNASRRELFSAIVPCKDEEDVLFSFLKEFKESVDKIPNIEWEIIFVEDGSKDATLDKIKEMNKEDGRIRYISFSRNFGKEAAMLAGLTEARGNYIAIMDADLQDPPELLPEMFKAIREDGYECAATRRSTRDGEPPLRTFGAKCFYKTLNAVSRIKFTEGARDFRLITRRVRDAILELPEYNRFLKGVYEYVGFKTKWFEFENRERIAGKTKWSTWGLILYSFEAITSFSTVPLALVALGGVLLSVVSVLAIVFLSIRQLIYHNSAFGFFH